ncbi:MAG: hypothetical protein P1U42_11960, partial [Phycisphaerales bacterium]|nr:hypothetical protein [Phycisphaerales bacterium]
MSSSNQTVIHYPGFFRQQDSLQSDPPSIVWTPDDLPVGFIPDEQSFLAPGCVPSEALPVELYLALNFDSKISPKDKIDIFNRAKDELENAYGGKILTAM